MQHFQHKERASKQLFMGAEPLSHLQLPLCEKRPSILTVPKYRGSSGDGEDRWPFPTSQTAITAAAAFRFGKQPFGKLGMRVCTVPGHLCERTHVLHTPSPKPSRHQAGICSDSNHDTSLCLSAPGTATSKSGGQS